MRSEATRRPAAADKPTRAPRGAAIVRPLQHQVDEVLSWLERSGSKAGREGMARFAIPSDKAFGVSVGALRQQAKRLGTNHELAAALWDTGWYEARMLAIFVDEPARVTSAQMDRWCRGFDNWAIVDTACFHLFDHTPHAWRKVEQWAGRRDEFGKRAGFTLLWSLSVHDKSADDASFIAGLQLIEREAGDDRHFVRKAINMALRAVGKRNRALNTAALVVARRLAGSAGRAPRWIGKDALRELTSASVLQRLAKKH
jgi:3-methyladenine DNA glycosylase AlkD